MPVAISHPGKIGDLLFSLPTAKYLSERHGCQVDVYTSTHCRIALDVVASQPYVNRAQVLEDYVMEHFDCGAQPWHMPVPDGYDAVYHLGFRSFPDRHCVPFMASQLGLPEPTEDAYRLTTPDLGTARRLGLDAPYIVVTTCSPTSGGSLTWAWSNPKVSEFVESCPYPVYAIGLDEEIAKYDCRSRLRTLSGLSFIEIADVMKQARAVVTFSTGLGVLAAGVLNGSGTPLICMFDGELDWRVFALPGSTTCSPDENLSNLVFRTRSQAELEQTVASLERARRALDKALVAQGEALRHDIYLRDVKVADLNNTIHDMQLALADARRRLDTIEAPRT